ncbi:MAG: sulfotransferase [Vulcanimicrobiota bacterium]
MELTRAICVSFPRSGHHLLVRLLWDYFNGPGPVSTHPEPNRAFVYCSYYGHCHQVPCSLPETNFQKHHDLDLSLATDLPCLVQVRSPLPALRSYYQLFEEGRLPRLEAEDWDTFARRGLAYHLAFCHKWLPRAGLVVSYESMLADPEATLSRVIEWLGAGSVDQTRVRQAIAQERPRPLDRYSIGPGWQAEHIHWDQAYRQMLTR